jgi:hypothetical protein
LSATTSSPYGLCYKTSANGIRGERRRRSGEMTNQAKHQGAVRERIPTR